MFPKNLIDPGPNVFTTSRTARNSYFDADGLEQRDLPTGLSDSARRAIEATEVEEAPGHREKW